MTQNYCATGEEIESKLSELSKMKPEEIIEMEKRVWTRTAPADLYYSRDEKGGGKILLVHLTYMSSEAVDLSGLGVRCPPTSGLDVHGLKPNQGRQIFLEKAICPMNPKVMRATPRLMELCEKFEKELSTRAAKVRAAQPKFELPPRKNRAKYFLTTTMTTNPSHFVVAAVTSSSDTDTNSESSTDEEDCTMEEMERKRLHPYRLHQELWFNDSGEMNDGPLCRCSARARKCGIRHGIYSGESSLMKCDLDTNNADKLYHYRITISPPTNFLTKTPTIIHYDEHEFIFEGFSMFSHFPLEKLPTCKVIRFNIEYMILYVEEKMPESFSIRQLDLFYDYIFHELLELVDLDFRAHDDKEGCPQFHFMPRFSRDLPDNGKEILSMNEVMRYLINNGGPLIDETKLAEFSNMPQFQWQNFADEIKGMVVTYPGMKPCSLRVDQLDRDQSKNDQQSYPEIVHFGIRPPQLSYAGNLE
uniref:Ribonuclease 3 central domain-containing protein n=1 Tax=Timema douglasi TaxID=61478 RepID=A0A7R8ZDZ4_TIMDO|nr:unnamed protein product [Timema douglasi]